MTPIVRRQGTCKYCGQMKLIEAPEGLLQSDIDELITSACTCDDAEHDREEADRRAELEENKRLCAKFIKDLFADDWQQAEQILTSAIDSMAAELLDSITMTKTEGGEKITATLKINAQGKMKVTRKATMVQERKN